MLKNANNFVALCAEGHLHLYLNILHGLDLILKRLTMKSAISYLNLLDFYFFDLLFLYNIFALSSLINMLSWLILKYLYM